jgi:hypothetical protein
MYNNLRTNEQNGMKNLVQDAIFEDDEILIAVEGVESYVFLCKIEKFNKWIEKYYGVEDFKVGVDVDYGEGEYGFENLVDWDEVAECYHNRDTVERYVRNQNIKLGGLLAVA